MNCKKTLLASLLTLSLMPVAGHASIKIANGSLVATGVNATGSFKDAQNELDHFNSYFYQAYGKNYADWKSDIGTTTANGQKFEDSILYWNTTLADQTRGSNGDPQGNLAVINSTVTKIRKDKADADAKADAQRAIDWRLASNRMDAARIGELKDAGLLDANNNLTTKAQLAINGGAGINEMIQQGLLNADGTLTQAGTDALTAIKNGTTPGSTHQTGNSPAPRITSGLTSTAGGSTQAEVDKAQNDAIVNHAQNLTDLWAQSDKNLNNIVTMAGKVQNNADAISDEETRAKGVEQSQKTLIDTNTANITTNTANIATNTTDIAGANKAVADLSHEVKRQADLHDALDRIDAARRQQEAEQKAAAVKDVADTIAHINARFATLDNTVNNLNTAAPVTVTPVTGATVTHTATTTPTTNAPSWLLKSTQGNLQTKGATLPAPQPTVVTQQQKDDSQDKAINDNATAAASAQQTATLANTKATQTATDMTTLTGRVTNNEGQISTLQSSVTTAQQQAQGAIQQAKQADTNAGQAKTDAATALTTAQTADQKATKAGQDAATALTTAQGVDQKATTAQTDAAAAKGDAAAAHTLADTAKQEADANTATLATHTTDIGNNKSAIATNKADIDGNRKQIVSLANTQQNYTTRIDHVQQGVDQNHADILSESHARYEGDKQTLKAANAYTDSKFANIDKRLSDVKKQANAGSASALAAVGIPALSGGQTWNIGAGVGQFGNAQAVAVGGSYRVTENVAFKVGGTASPTTQDFGVFAGVSIGN